MGKFGKEEWVGMFKETGLSKEMMMKWHRIFETKHPEGHQSFLEWLGLDSAGIAKIRESSRK